MNLLETRRGRVLVFTLLYFSEGAPIGFIWWALPALLRSENLAVADITGLTAVLILPWTFKFLWAPLVDWLRSPRFGFRGWIMAAQVCMGLALLPLSGIEPGENLFMLRSLLLLHAIAAATQDIAIDALVINATRADERGLLNGCMQAGMLTGRSLFGGGALLMISIFGWNGIVWLLSGCILATCSLLAFVREPAAQGSGATRFGSQLRAAAREPLIWRGLAFALISAAAFEAAGALAGPFFVDREMTKETIGFFFAIPAVAAMLIGGLAGGKLSDRLGRVRSAKFFLVGFASAVFVLGAAGSHGAPGESAFFWFGIYTVLYFCIGAFTAASYALFMDLTHPRIGATQFSTFMAATNGCELWSTWAAGRLVDWNGYAVAFVSMSAVSLASLPLLYSLAAKRR